MSDDFRGWTVSPTGRAKTPCDAWMWTSITSITSRWDIPIPATFVGCAPLLLAKVGAVFCFQDRVILRVIFMVVSTHSVSCLGSYLINRRPGYTIYCIFQYFWWKGRLGSRAGVPSQSERYLLYTDTHQHHELPHTIRAFTFRPL